MSLSVQIDRLSIGSNYLDGQKFSPPLKRRAEHALSNILSNRHITIENQKTPFHLKIDPQTATIQLNDRKITLQEKRELKQIERLCRYHQHTGHLPRSGMTPKEEVLRDQTTQKAIRDVNKAAVPGTNGHILAGMRIAEDTLSVTRNFLYALPTIGPDDPIVNHLGYYAGIFWTFFAFRELDGGIAELKRSKLVGDAEGERRAATRVLSGGICSTASLSYLLGRVSDSFVSAPLAAGLIDTANILFGLGSVLSMGSATLGAMRCYRFNNRLNEYLGNKNITQVEKLRGALQFLKDAVSITPEERSQMRAEIDQNHPDWTPEQKEKLLNQKITDLTEVKVKYLKRRTSNKSLQLILNQANKILEKLANPETQAEGIKEATIMLDTIQKENKTKMALYILGFIAALISFAAMAIMTFMTAGALPFVLYGIAGTIYLGVTIYSIAGMLTKKDPDGGKAIDLHPIQDIGPHDGGHHISI